MSDRRSFVAASAVAVLLGAVVALAPVAPARAQVVAEPRTTTPPATEPPQTTTTTTAPPVTLPVPPTTSAPPDTTPPPAPGPTPEDTTTTSPPGLPSDQPPPGDTGDTGAIGDGDGGPPPQMGDDAVALILDDRVRSGDSSTAALLDALRPLTAAGFSETEALALGMGRFPVAGLATWSDDFHDARYNPKPHLHQGNDIWAAFGTPVRSPADGVLELTDEAVGGKSAYVTTPDGTYYYMTHLGDFAPDLSTGDAVAQGQVVGFNGATGNAAGGPPHVHFEIHPGGGGAVNPKPILDQWVADALAAAPALFGGQQTANPRVLLATGELRRFDVPTAATSERAAKSPLLWSSSVSSGGAALRLAEVEAARMAQQVDWSSHALRAQSAANERHQAEQRAVNLLSRLTPAGLRSVLDPDAS